MFVDIGAAWANVNRGAHSNMPHIHPKAVVSGAYYVDGGGLANTTLYVYAAHAHRGHVAHYISPSLAPCSFFASPRGAQAGEELRVGGHPGVLVLFPAWAEHYVEPHLGDRPRISISFNARVEHLGGERAGARPHLQHKGLTLLMPKHHRTFELDEAAHPAPHIV